MPPPEHPVRRDIRIQREFAAALAAADARRLIDLKWHELGGAPGAAISSTRPGEPAATASHGGHFVEFERGRIYASPKARGQATARYVYGAILEHYIAMGGPGSWLGWPQSDEGDFSEGGRVSAFERGSIYWWPDTGPMAIDQVILRYHGLACYGETDWDQGSTEDEPYGVFSTTIPTGGQLTTMTTLSPIYGGVDGGESRPDSIDLYRGKPHGLVLTSVLMEHDAGDRDVYRREIDEAVSKASELVSELMLVIPVAGPVLKPVASAILGALHGDIVDAINDTVDAGDDVLGTATISLSPKQMCILAKRDENLPGAPMPAEIETPLISGAGASYKFFFSLRDGR